MRDATGELPEALKPVRLASQVIGRLLNFSGVARVGFSSNLGVLLNIYFVALLAGCCLGSDSSETETVKRKIRVSRHLIILQHPT